MNWRTWRLEAAGAGLIELRLEVTLKLKNRAKMMLDVLKCIYVIVFVDVTETYNFFYHCYLCLKTLPDATNRKIYSRPCIEASLQSVIPILENREEPKRLFRASSTFSASERSQIQKFANSPHLLMTAIVS